MPALNIYGDQITLYVPNHFPLSACGEGVKGEVGMVECYRRHDASRPYNCDGGEAYRPPMMAM